MKPFDSLILCAALYLGTADVIGECEGTVIFANKEGPVDAPFYNQNHQLLNGGRYVAQLYAGTNADGLVSFGLVLPFGTGARAGYVFSIDDDSIPFMVLPGSWGFS